MIICNSHECAYCRSPIAAGQRWVRVKIYESEAQQPVRGFWELLVRSTNLTSKSNRMAWPDFSTFRPQEVLSVLRLPLLNLSPPKFMLSLRPYRSESSPNMYTCILKLGAYVISD
jgi:hypothetical protein